MFRPLHYVFRLGNRKTIKSFFVDILGMKVLRHEEFKEGCEATCNGPYNGRWSKTMIGYGKEDDNFVIELTYNYGISTYKSSNDLKYVKINSSKVISNLIQANYPFTQLSNKPETVLLTSPDGYQFLVVNHDIDGKNMLSAVSLTVTDLKISTDYYAGLLPGTVISRSLSTSVIGFESYQFTLELEVTHEPIVKTTASGRIAFSFVDDVASIERSMRENDQKIKTSLITLATPGKASVDVVILLDPNEHEICVVGDRGFRELSKYDCEALHLLEDAMVEDKSEEWFSKHGGKLSG